MAKSDGDESRLAPVLLRHRIGALVVGLAVTLGSLAGGNGVVYGQSAGDTIDNFTPPSDLGSLPLGRLGAVEEIGTGDTDLLLIPGARFGWKVWRGFMHRNADRYRMVAVSPPGYGGTPPPPMPESRDFSRRVWSDALVTSLADLIRARGLEDPVVIGHHLTGDYYALRLGLEYPERIGGVVIVSGAPARPAPDSLAGDDGRVSLEEREKWVNEQRAEFFRTVDRDTWNRNTYQAPMLSRDSVRATALYERQIDVPLSTQLRYFLEYLSDDLRPRMSEFRPPLLVVQPVPTFEDLLDQRREALIQRFGSMARAGERMREMAVERFGSVAAALEAGTPLAAWRSLDVAAEIRTVKGARIFVMHDRPEEFDAIVREFIETRGR